MRYDIRSMRLIISYEEADGEPTRRFHVQEPDVRGSTRTRPAETTARSRCSRQRHQSAQWADVRGSHVHVVGSFFRYCSLDGPFSEPPVMWSLTEPRAPVRGNRGAPGKGAERILHKGIKLTKTYKKHNFKKSNFSKFRKFLYILLCAFGSRLVNSEEWALGHAQWGNEY